MNKEDTDICIGIILILRCEIRVRVAAYMHPLSHLINPKPVLPVLFLSILLHRTSREIWQTVMSLKQYFDSVVIKN